MKKVKVIFCFLFLFFIACKEQNKEMKVKLSVSENKVLISQKNADLNNFIDEYECKHHDTPTIDGTIVNFVSQ